MPKKAKTTDAETVIRRSTARARDGDRRKRICDQLQRTYGNAGCALEHRNPFELLVATILSAQCTDARVNIVTRSLFKKYRSPGDYASAPRSEIENEIRSTGFFRSKAKSIQGMAEAVRDEHGGTVPRSMDALVRLPGVGRKTANVILGTAFGLNEGVVVDTHVARLSRRLGFTAERDPVKIERNLMALFPKKEWTQLSHWLIHHGRAVCTARNPRCGLCPLERLCPKTGVLPKKGVDNRRRTGVR